MRPYDAGIQRQRVALTTGLLRRPWAVGVLLMATLFAPRLSSAQEESTAREVPLREAEAEAQAKKAAAEAETRAALETSQPVTYEQVLADPDNIQLNFLYARTLVAQGNLRGAEATLERILMVNPELAQVRLFHALVLMRLNNLDEAEQEFAALKGKEMPPSLRQELQTYVREIRLRRRVTRYHASLTIGYAFDTNRNAAPSSKERLAADIPTALVGTSKRRHDTSLLVIHSLGFTHDLGMQAGHQLTGEFNYFLGEQTRADDFDLQSFSLKGGAVVKSPWAELTPSLFMSHTMLSRETYLRSQGLSGGVERPLGKRTTVAVETQWEHEAYSGISENTAAAERTGDRTSVEGGPTFALTPTMQLSGRVSYVNKQAKAAYFRYDGIGVEGTHVWLVGHGQFLITNLTYDFNTYDQADTSVSERQRRDKELRVRMTYGAPISLFLGKHLTAGPILEGLTLTTSVEQFRALSNITNYTYANRKFSVMVTKRVEF